MNIPSASNPSTLCPRPPCVILPALLFALFAPLACAADFHDNQIGLRYGNDFREPGVVDANGADARIGKTIIGYTYVDGAAKGGNFLNVDVYFSDKHDPDKDGDHGATEAYMVYRRTFAPSGWSGTMHGFGPVRDTVIVAGLDLNTKNTAFDPRKKSVVMGPQFQFDVKDGFFNLGIEAYKEFNHNGIVGRNVTFDTTLALESSWSRDYRWGSVPVTFKGFLNVVAPKGTDGFGDETKTEVLARPQLMFDVGALGGHPGKFKLGVGWEYWYNKFGANHRTVPGALQSTALVLAEWHP